MTLGFSKQPLTRTVARGMRAATKGKELDGHRFSYNNLKELWISEDERHVVVTHDDDKLWQYWLDAPEGGWALASVHKSREAAQSAALDHEIPEAQPETGLYVLATKGEGSRTIRVKCESSEGPEFWVRTFTKLGYSTSVEEVGPAQALRRVV